MSNTAPPDRMAPARAAKAQQLAERKRLAQLEQMKQQQTKPTATLHIHQDNEAMQKAMEEEMESWSESEEEPTPPPKKRQREITIEPFRAEPTPPPRKRTRNVTTDESNFPTVDLRQHALNFLYGALPVVGQLTLLVGGVLCSIAMRTPVEAPSTNVQKPIVSRVDPHPTMEYVAPAAVRSRNPDEYSLL